MSCFKSQKKLGIVKENPKKYEPKQKEPIKFEQKNKEIEGTKNEF